MLLLHPLGVPTGQAMGVGLLWYAMTLLVSLLGAPAFAVGNSAGVPTTPARLRRSTPTPADRRPHARGRGRRRHERRRTGRTHPAATVPLHRRLPGGRSSATAGTSTGGSRSSRSSSSTSSTRIRNLHTATRTRRSSTRPDHPLAADARDLPRADDPGLGAGCAADHRRQLLLRVAALHRDRRRDDLPVPQVERRLPALAQHPRDRHRARAHRLHVLPADAAAPAPPLRVRPLPSASSTRSPSTRRSGRSTPAR